MTHPPAVFQRLIDEGYAQLLDVVLRRDDEQHVPWRRQDALPAGVKLRARDLLRDREAINRLRAYWAEGASRPLADWRAFPPDLGVYVLLVDGDVAYVGSAIGTNGLRGRLGEHFDQASHGLYVFAAEVVTVRAGLARDGLHAMVLEYASQRVLRPRLRSLRPPHRAGLTRLAEGA